MEKRRFNNEEMERAKRVNMRKYLGLRKGQNILSPFRDEKTPSFSIYRNKDTGHWQGKDHGGRTEPYDAIAIVQSMEKVDFVTAVKSLLAFAEGQETTERREHDTNIDSGQNSSPEGSRMAQEKKNINYEWLEDNKEGLEYLKNVRKISPGVIEKIKDKIKVVDVIIEKNDGTYRNRMIAFPTLGGWICRSINNASPVRKHIIGQSGLTTISNPNARNVYIFESCIDALSYESLNPTKNAVLISLNSVSNYKKLAELSLQGRTLNLCLDNDAAGWEAVEKIKEMFPVNTNVMKYLQILECKDVNDVLINQHFVNRMEKKREKNDVSDIMNPTDHIKTCQHKNMSI
jgi:hypothetical protein